MAPLSVGVCDRRRLVEVGGGALGGIAGAASRGRLLHGLGAPYRNPR
jgi:hypothetical protein